MALNIKNSDVERLAAEVAVLSGTSKTEAIRQALLDRREKVSAMGRTQSRAEALRELLTTKIWPRVPESARRTLTKAEEEEILGYDEHGEPV